MPASAVHIAGVGISLSTKSDLDNLAVSAGTKALLDAGITYGKVELGVACFLNEPDIRITRSCFKAFGRQKACVSEIDGHSALFTAVQCVRSGQTDCALLVGVDSQEPVRNRKSSLASCTDMASQIEENSDKRQVAAVGIVLISDRFMTSHAYLKDSAACIRACISIPLSSPRPPVQEALRKACLEAKDIQMVEAQGGASFSRIGLDLPKAGGGPLGSNTSSAGLKPLKDFGVTGWVGLCRLVWRLRGWSQEPHGKLQNCMQCISGHDESCAAVLILSRSDGNMAPSYKEVEHLRDGRERLRYNPALGLREIHREDLEAVRTREGDRMPLGGDEGVGEIKRLASRGGDRASLSRL